MFLTQLVSFILEQNTTSNVVIGQQGSNSLNYSQKSAILAFLLMKQACSQIEVLKK